MKLHYWSRGLGHHRYSRTQKPKNLHRKEHTPWQFGLESISRCSTLSCQTTTNHTKFYLQNGHQKYMCWKEIAPHARVLIIVIDVIVNMIEETYMIIYYLKEFSHWQWMGHSYEHQKLPWMWLHAQFKFANHLALICMFHILQEVCA